MEDANDSLIIQGRLSWQPLCERRLQGSPLQPLMLPQYHVRLALRRSYCIFVSAVPYKSGSKIHVFRFFLDNMVFLSAPADLSPVTQ